MQQVAISTTVNKRVPDDRDGDGWCLKWTWCGADRGMNEERDANDADQESLPDSRKDSNYERMTNSTLNLFLDGHTYS